MYDCMYCTRTKSAEILKLPIELSKVVHAPSASYLRFSGRPRRKPRIELGDVGRVGLVAEGGDVRRRVPLLLDHPPVDRGEETVRFHGVRPRGPQPLLHGAAQQFPDDKKERDVSF